MHISFPCILRTHKLANVIKILEKIGHILPIVLHLRMKSYLQIHYILAIPKRHISDRFLPLKLSIFFTFLLRLKYNEFEYETF